MPKLLKVRPNRLGHRNPPGWPGRYGKRPTRPIRPISPISPLKPELSPRQLEDQLPAASRLLLARSSLWSDFYQVRLRLQGGLIDGDYLRLHA